MRTDALIDSARLADLLSREHAAAADFLLALADFDARELHRDLGYASLFDYLHRELGLSRGAAHYRKVAARLARAHPAVVEALRDGRLCITSVVELARVLTPANEAEVLPRFFHRSRREAREVAAALSPAPVVPNRATVTTLQSLTPAVHRVQPVELDMTASTASAEGPGVQPVEPEVARSRVAPADPPAAGRTVPLTSPPADFARHSTSAAGPDASPADGPPPSLTLEPLPSPAVNRPQPVDETTPLTSDRFRLHVTVSRRFLSMLDAARAARSHARPGATAEDVLEEALGLLLTREARRREATTTRRPPPARPSGPGHVPAAVRREVWARDGGCCQWPLATGGVCGSAHRLELDHIVPRALDGPSTTENLRLLCQPHNLEAARGAFGDFVVDRYAAPRPRDAPRVNRPKVREAARVGALHGTRDSPPA